MADVIVDWTRYMGAETLLRPDLEALIRLGSEYGIEQVGLDFI